VKKETKRHRSSQKERTTPPEEIFKEDEGLARNEKSHHLKEREGEKREKSRDVERHYSLGEVPRGGTTKEKRGVEKEVEDRESSALGAPFTWERGTKGSGSKLTAEKDFL